MGGMTMNRTKSTVLAAINFTAKTLHLKPNEHHLYGFAEACFNQNSDEELIDAICDGPADKTDCENWGITASEWQDSICRALEYRLFLAIENMEHYDV